MADNPTVDNGALTDYPVRSIDKGSAGPVSQIVLIDVGGTGAEDLVTKDVAGKVPTTAQGQVAHDAVDAGNPIKIGGKVTTGVPTAVADADRVDAWLEADGALVTSNRELARGDATWTSATAGDTTLEINVRRAGTAVLWIRPSGSITDGHLTFECTINGGTSWVPVSGSNGSYVQTGVYLGGGDFFSGAEAGWRIPVMGFDAVRIRLDTAIVGAGSLFVSARAVSAPVTPFTISRPTCRVGGPSSINLASANAAVTISLDGVESLAFRITGLSSSGATVKFETQAPGSGLWFFLACFNMVNAESGGIGTAFSNDFETSATANGVWIATGLGGFSNIRIRVSTTGSGTATVDWTSNGAPGYTFSQIFGDLRHNSPELAVWPVMIGGSSFSSAGAAALALDTLPTPVGDNARRTRVSMSPYGEMRVLQTDKHRHADITAISQTAAIPLEGSVGVAVQIRGTWVGTLAFEMSYDGINWSVAVGFNTETYAGTFDLTTTANGTWTFILTNGAAYLRVRSTAWTSGTATVTLRGTMSPAIQTSLVMGDKQHDATDGTTSPIKIGGKAEATRPATVADNDRTNAWIDTAGRQIVQLGSSEYTAPVAQEYTTDQTDTSLIAAPGSNLRIVIWDIVVGAGSAGTVLLESGTATRLFGRISLAANGGWSFNSAKGFRLPANTSLTITSTGTINPLAVTVNYSIEQDLTVAGVA